MPSIEIIVSIRLVVPEHKETDVERIPDISSSSEQQASLIKMLRSCAECA